jgi:predicted NBD/HSP70 family sugar kinase
MGIVMDGKLYSGPRMAAGEFGQMVIADSPGPERHDRAGCLETLASNPATGERYQHLTGGRLRAGIGNSTEQVKRICQLAMEGDPVARQTIAETSRYLGIGIANAVWTLDAEAVVIDGALTEAWPLVVAGIREQLPDGQRFLNFRNLMLRPSSLRGEATIIGAFTLPFAGLFSSDDGVRP